MLKRPLLSLPLAALLIGAAAFPALSLAQQDTAKRGRKYTPPPETAHISVKVVKATNGKPVERAAVIFHVTEGPEKNKGNMELKTNDEGLTSIDVIAIGETVRLQILADGFQTFGDDYKIDSATKEIIVKLKRPAKQYSTYEHPELQSDAPAKPDQPAQDSSATPPPK